MKRLLKFAFAAVLVASAVVASFAFVGKKSEVKFAPNTYFEYTGPDNAAVNVKNPLYYTQVVNAPVSGPDFEKLSGLYVTSSLHIYTSGTFIGKPKVDQTSVFQTDLLDATDLTPTEFRKADYHIYLKPL